MSSKRAFAILTVFLVLLSLSVMVLAAPNPKGLRDRIQERLEEANERFENAKERFENQKERFEDAKNKWLQYKSDWNSGRNKDINRLYQGAKNYMLRSTERMVDYLEMTKSRVEKIKDLPEADLNLITAQIDSKIASLENLKAKINDSNFNEEIKALTIEVKQKWDAVKAFSKKIVGLILAANTQKSINVAEKIADKAEERLNALDQNSIDTNSARQALNEMRNNIELAKTAKANAVAKFLQISDQNSSKELFNEGHDLLKEAHKHLRDAHKSLKNIIQEIVSKKKQNREQERNRNRDQNRIRDDNDEEDTNNSTPDLNRSNDDQNESEDENED